MSLSRALTSLGRARRAHGLPERALDAYTEAMAVQKKTGDRFGVVQTWNAMGVAWSNMERPGKALECYRNGLAEAVALGDQSAVQFMEGAVATALLRTGKAAEAIPIFEGILAKNPEPYIARFRLAALADAYLTSAGQPTRSRPSTRRWRSTRPRIPTRSRRSSTRGPAPTPRWAGRTRRSPMRGRRSRPTSASGSRCCRWTSSSAATAT